MSYTTTPREFNAVSGTTAVAALTAAATIARKAILRNAHATATLLVGTADDAVMGISMSPGDEYVFECPQGMRFDLRKIVTKDQAGATAITVHVLYWSVL
jgi:hypothetical protein